MSGFDRYFHAPFAAARAYVFSRVFLALVALDAWMLMIGHAGRYGVDGFNVAHFDWLDALAPMPSAGLYIGVLLLTGLIAAALALVPAPRPALLALFFLYTYSWAMSMLDSYQHHYFVSSVLLCLVFFPVLRASDVHPHLAAVSPSAAPASSPASPSAAPAAESRKGKRPKSKAKAKREAAAESAERSTARRGTLYAALGWVAIALCALASSGGSSLGWIVATALLLAASTAFVARQQPQPPALARGFGFNLLGATAAVLYTYTAIAKLDAPWRDGHTFTRITTAKRVFAPLAQYAGELGMPEDAFWSLVATSVIPVELAIAATYLVAVRADSLASRLARWMALGGFALALTLHVGAEALELEIGWFSYYMLLFACAYLLPARMVDTLAQLLTVPARFMSAQLADLLAPRERTHAAAGTLAMAAAVALMLGAVGKLLDLPGAAPACMTAAALALTLSAAAALRGRALEVRPLLLGTGFAAAAMWLAIAQSDSRWDFYRYLGGDLRRRGQPEAALEAYERGERYAPEGQSRKTQIDELRRELGR